MRGGTHAERLDNFYRDQASNYDEFRKKLLWGREDLIQKIDFSKVSTWCDLGCGTGSNLISALPYLNPNSKVYLFDLSESLLEIAQKINLESRSDINLYIQKQDVTQLPTASESVDLVTFSYSLTMIPDWIAALKEAERILKPGGVIAIVDFYIGQKFHHSNNSLWTRTFWPFWFGMDNVFPSPDMLPYLKHGFKVQTLNEHKHRIPYLMGLSAPVFQFVGHKK